MVEHEYICPDCGIRWSYSLPDGSQATSIVCTHSKAYHMGYRLEIAPLEANPVFTIRWEAKE